MSWYRRYHVPCMMYSRMIIFSPDPTSIPVYFLVYPTIPLLVLIDVVIVMVSDLTGGL